MQRQPPTNSPHQRRQAFTLMETIIAFSLAALLMTPVVGLLKTTHDVHQQIDNDQARLNSLHGTLQHISRRVRTAASVEVISSAGKGEPALLEILDRNGSAERWAFDSRAGTVEYTQAGQSGVLSEDIDDLIFEGYTDKGTRTDDAQQVHSIRCIATIQLRRNQNEKQTTSCRVCLRRID